MEEVLLRRFGTSLHATKWSSSQLTSSQRKDRGKIERTSHSVVDLSERRFPSEKFDDGAAERPDIRSCRGSFHLDDFRSHPIRRSCNVVLLLVLDGDEIERDSEIREFDVPRLGREDVGGLEIAVDHLQKRGEKRERENG